MWFDTFSTAVAEDAAGLMHVFAVDRTATFRFPPHARHHPFGCTADTVLVAEARRHAAPVSDKHPKLTNGDIPVVGGVGIHAAATDSGNADFSTLIFLSGLSIFRHSDQGKKN